MVSTALEEDLTDTFNKVRAQTPRFTRLAGKDHEAADL
jgi:hypothetical protein